MSNETIKDQVRRLIAGIAPCYEKRPDLIKDDDYCFGFMLEVVELAIAEEREACVQKAALWALTKDMSSNLRLGLASAIRGRAYSADKGKQDRKGMT